MPHSFYEYFGSLLRIFSSFLGKDFWRWQMQNPNGYADDAPFPVSELTEEQSSTNTGKVPQIEVNGVNGHHQSQETKN